MKDKFWKICAVIFLVLLFLNVWMNRYDVKFDGSILTKLNKFTGKVYIIRAEEIEYKWQRVEREK